MSAGELTVLAGGVMTVDATGVLGEVLALGGAADPASRAHRPTVRARR
jgi:hypothetical protein